MPNFIYLLAKIFCANVISSVQEILLCHVGLPDHPFLSVLFFHLLFLQNSSIKSFVLDNIAFLHLLYFDLLSAFFLSCVYFCGPT